MNDFFEDESRLDKTLAKREKHTLWVEKYRPATLDEYVGHSDIKEQIKLFIEKKDIPNLLFSGPAGTGKTTLAKLIVQHIPCDVMTINASDENGIETIRDKIKNFAYSAGFRPLKVIILDEADFLTLNAQSVLRNLLETYSAHTRFILTCNYVEKIIPALISRTQGFEIRPSSKKEGAVKLAEILTIENVQFTQEDIVFIINSFHPDMRKVLNFAQQSTVNGVIKISKQSIVNNDFIEKIVEILKSPKLSSFGEIRQLVADFDPNSFDALYKQLFEKVDSYGKGKDALIIVELAESLYQSSLVIPKARDLTFLACVYKILKHLK